MMIITSAYVYKIRRDTNDKIKKSQLHFPTMPSEYIHCGEDWSVLKRYQ